jgi:hypothetical protein
MTGPTAPDVPQTTGRRSLITGALALAALLLAAYVFSIGLRATRGASITADEPFYLLTTQSLIQDGDLDLTQQYARESYRSFFDHPDGLWKQSVPDESGRLLSPHDPGLSILLIPGFALGGLRGAQVQMMTIAAATFALAFVLTAMETKARRTSWLITAAAGLSATPFVYATEIYPEVPAAFCIVLSIFAVRTPGGGTLRAAVLAGLLTALAWLGMKYIPLACLVALFFLWRATTGGRLTLLALGAVAAASYIWLHYAIFGALTPYSVSTVYEGASTGVVLESHIAFRERFYRVWGLFIDRRFGIGRWAPLFLLVLPALPLLVRRGPLGLLSVALIVAQVLIGTFVAITMMGWWFPGRTLMAVIPLFPLVLTALALRVSRPFHVVMAALAAYSLLVTLLLVVATWRGEVTLAVDPFDMPAVPFQVLSPLFPQYTSWPVETVILTVAWLAAGAALTVALARREFWPVLSRSGRAEPGIQAAGRRFPEAR